MKYFIIIFIVVGLFNGCTDLCSSGEMDCDKNRSRMCSSVQAWEIYQDCGAIELICSYDCSGFSNITCCK